MKIWLAALSTMAVVVAGCGNEPDGNPSYRLGYDSDTAASLTRSGMAPQYACAAAWEERFNSQAPGDYSRSDFMAGCMGHMRERYGDAADETPATTIGVR